MSSDEPKKVNAILILEVLGRPAEFLTETLERLAKEIGAEKGVKLIHNKVNPPAEMKERKGFYSSFGEIEIETDSTMYLAILIFKYMPAHVEILSPQNFNLTNVELNEILNELTRRLHGYEEIARILQNEKFILENKLRELLPKPKVTEIKKEKRAKRGKK